MIAPGAQGCCCSGMAPWCLPVEETGIRTLAGLNSKMAKESDSNSAIEQEKHERSVPILGRNGIKIDCMLAARMPTNAGLCDG